MRLEPRPWLSIILPRVGKITDVRMENAENSAHAFPVATLCKTRGTEVVRLYQLGLRADEGHKALLHDIRRLQRVHHPHLCSVLGLCYSDALLFVVSSHCKGNPLVPFLSGTPVINRRRIASQLIDAVRFLQSLGIVHGNVKSDNVWMLDGAPILSGFPSTYGRSANPVPLSTEWPENREELTYTIPDDTDAPAEALAEFPKNYWTHPFYVDDSDVPDDVRQRVRALLQSANEAEDMFALAFLVIEIFSGLSPSGSQRAFQIFRMAKAGRRPSHPGRLAALRGFDRFYWQFCLSCWGFGPGDETTLEHRFKRLLQDWDRSIVIHPPLELPHSVVRRLSDEIDSLETQVYDLHDVRDGRDAEAQLYEVQGTWKRKNEEPVLVKVVTPTLCRRGSLRRPEDFQAEAYVWSQLRHPNVLPLLGIVRYEDTACFVTYWMAGGTCVDFLQANPGADRLKIVRLSQLIQVADALHYLHSREPAVVHGYVRASNVFISDSGDAFLSNFDFQPLQDPERNFDDSRYDDAGRWIPPELNFTMDRTTKTDVYSFGMMAYELYSGKKPFYEIPERAGNTSVWATMYAGGRPGRPQHLSLTDDIWAMIERCWNHSPAARPSIETVVGEFRRIRGSRIAS